MDEIYIPKVLNGDANAFRFLIRKYKDIGYSLAMSVVKDEFAAQDVLQASFVIAFSKLSTFKGKSKFCTWLYRIIINEAFKALKKQKKDIVSYQESPVNHSVDIDETGLKIEGDDQRYYINEALKLLSPNESLALRLFYLGENSIEEITEITGWSNSNVKVILHRARINMRHMLESRFKVNQTAFYQ
jgi:RNA polymerase sigma factor (sigma-70 family)